MPLILTTTGFKLEFNFKGSESGFLIAKYKYKGSIKFLPYTLKPFI